MRYEAVHDKVAPRVEGLGSNVTGLRFGFCRYCGFALRYADRSILQNTSEIAW